MSEENELSALEKAAVILMSLGKDQAAEVMKFLSESEVKKLSRAFMAVREVGRETQHGIAGEFHRMLQAAETVVVDGQEFARDVIASAFGEDSGAMMLDYITGSRKEPLSTIINEVPDNILETFVQSEHPQTVAFLLSKMKADKAAELLDKMTEEMQVDAMVRLSQLNNVKSDIIDEVREVFRSQLRGVGLSDQEELGGTKTAADILNFVDRSAEERILTEMEETFPELSDEIRNLMFTFEDVLKLEDRAIQTVLKEVPREELVLALKTASEELRSLLFRNISQRAAAMLAEDLETMGPTKLKDVEKAQQVIIDIIRKLESEGKIAVAGGGDDVLV